MRLSVAATHPEHGAFFSAQLAAARSGSGVRSEASDLSRLWRCGVARACCMSVYLQRMPLQPCQMGTGLALKDCGHWMHHACFASSCRGLAVLYAHDFRADRMCNGNAQRRAMLRRYGYMPHRVAFWIYWQAVRLLWLGLPFHGYPPAAAQDAAEAAARNPSNTRGSHFAWQSPLCFPWNLACVCMESA